MEMTLRWYSAKFNTVTLRQIRQIPDDPAWSVFGLDLYEAGLAETVTGYLRELTAGPGSVRATLKKHVHG